jgi:hypothetical protein
VKRIFRAARHLLLMLVAALGGAVVRLVRRMLRRPPRMWHGMFPLVITKYIAAAERKAGYPARSVAAHTSPFSYALVRAEEFDLVLKERGVAWYDVHWEGLFDQIGRAHF